MADLKSFIVTRNGQRVSMMQWDGTTQWIFPFAVAVQSVVAALTGNDRLLVALDFFKNSADPKPEY